MADSRTTLETVIQTALDSMLKEVHTCLPCVIQSFDKVNQLVNVQPTIKRKIKGELVDLPLLTGVPIRFPKTSDFSITWPIKIDDHVIVFFAERSIDNWLLNGGVQNPGDLRRHNLSDGFAMPMMYPQTDLITNFDDTNLQIKTTAGQGITLTPAGIIELNGNADNAVAYADLLIAFNQLKSDLDTHIHTTTATIGSSGTPGVISIPTSTSSADMSGSKVDTVKVP